MDDALVLRGGFVGFPLGAVTFAQPEDRRRRQLAVLVKLRGQRLVIGNGRVEIAVGLFLDQPLLQERGEAVGLGRREGRGQKNRQNAQCCFHSSHGCSLPETPFPFVTLLQNHNSSLYPTPCTVLRCRGASGFFSSLARRLAMWLSTVRVVGKAA